MSKIYYKEQYIGDMEPNMSPQQFLEFAGFANVNDSDIRIELLSQEVKANARDDIKEQIGDTETLLGIMSDVLVILLDLSCVSLSSITSEEEKQKIIQLYAIDWESIQTKSNEWLNKRHTGEIKTTTTVKGLNKIFEDVAYASTITSEILSRKYNAV